MEAVWRFWWCPLVWFCGCLADQITNCWRPCPLSISQYGTLRSHHDRPGRVDRTCGPACGGGAAIRTRHLKDAMRFDQYRLYQAWDVVIALSVTCVAVEIPFRLVLKYASVMGMMGHDGVITLILCLDVFVQWYRLESERRLAVAHATRAVSTRIAWLSIDLLAAIPLQLFLSATPLSLVQLVKLARVAQRMRQWRHHAVQLTSVLRLAFFAYWLLLTAHWLACGWLALNGNTTLADQVAVYGFRRYLRALYWSITTLATIGYGDLTPTTDAQIVFTMVVMLLGVAVYGYVIGNVTSLLANIDLAKRHYRENMERLGAFMHYRDIPPILQRRLRDYYAYLWEHRLGYDEASV